MFVRLIFSSPPGSLSGHTVVWFHRKLGHWRRLCPQMKKTPQMLQAHAFMISHSNKLAARGGKEVPATNHYCNPICLLSFCFWVLRPPLLLVLENDRVLVLENNCVGK